MNHSQSSKSTQTYRLNPSQNSAINQDSNQRLNDERYYRSNVNNNLIVDDYDNLGARMDQSQLDYGASRLNEGDSRFIEPRYKKGTFDNHEFSNVGHWYPAMPRDYPFEESKRLSKRSSEESTGIQTSSPKSSANSKSDSPPEGAASGSSLAVIEKREDKPSSSKEEQKSLKLTSSNGKTKNEKAGVALKQSPSEDVKRSSREVKEDNCEEEPEEPESNADFVWYNEEENSDLKESKLKEKKAQLMDDYDDEDDMGPKKRRDIENNYDAIDSY